MKALKFIEGGLLALIGGVSVFMTLSVIFDLWGIREKQGNYVLFIVYANLICGLIYLFTVYAIWKKPKYAVYGLSAALAILVIAFAGLQSHIANGGLYEEKTVKAMIFRMSFTAVMALLSWFIFKKSNQKS